jgi:hypothetical protein|tara:strand:- start:43 stop:3189 length:3147 start_codon:yes stop_codon:yes gene_type:complete
VIDVRAVGFGRTAPEQLSRLIRESKQDDVFAPVSVIVPTNYAAVNLRRDLAGGEFGATSEVGRGLVGTSFFSFYRLAEALSADDFAIEGRRPLSTNVVEAAVRQVLSSEPGIFSSIAHHGATERALVQVHRELRDLDDDELDVLAAVSERSGEVVRVYRSTVELLGERWFDEFDLFRSAAPSASKVSELGTAVLFLPQQLTNTAARFFLGLSEMTPTVALVGVTGVYAADEDARRTASLLGSDLPAVSLQAAPASQILSVSDPDDEVRSVIRSVVGLLDQGVTPDQIAVLYPHRNPYTRLLEEQLDAAGVCFNGESARTLADSMLGRFIISVLGLPDKDLRVNEVLAFLASAPIRQFPDDPLHAPAVAWSRRAAVAGVSTGLEDWVEKLGRHREQLLETAIRERLRTADETRVARYEKSATEAQDLLAFVSDLSEKMNPDALPQDWLGLCSWLSEVIDRYLGPSSELGASNSTIVPIEAILDQLGSLNRVEGSVNFSVFRRTLEMQLNDSVERIGKLGHGIFVGRIRQAWGLNFQHVLVLGLAEGIFPLPRREDGLLTDEDRLHLKGSLGLSREEPNHDHRRFLSTLSSCSNSVLFFPRGDLRQHSERYPTRWLEQIAVREGVASLDDALRSPEHDWAQLQASFVSGLRRSSFPSTKTEFDLAGLLDRRDQSRDLGDAPLIDASAFDLGRQLIEHRSSDQFTRFDGNLSGSVNSVATQIDALSATRLKHWADCPHSYFMRYVLGVEEPEFSGDGFRISPLERGSLLHEAADRFFRDQLADGSPPGPERPYSASDISSIRQFGLEVAMELESQGLVGRPLFWSRDREKLLNDLSGILRFDHQREVRGTVVATEFRFGLPGSDVPPVRRILPSGKVVHFGGSVDRVERTDDGNLVVVDYKTGKLDSYKKLGPKDPVLGGSQLQLPVYALAAHASLGSGSEPVHASYWFTSSDQRWKTMGYAVTSEVLASFDKAVDIIVTGIEEGLFPANPDLSSPSWGGSPRCLFCDPDELGTRHLEAKWESLASVESLAPYRELRGEVVEAERGHDSSD